MSHLAFKIFRYFLARSRRSLGYHVKNLRESQELPQMLLLRFVSLIANWNLGVSFVYPVHSIRARSSAPLSMLANSQNEAHYKDSNQASLKLKQKKIWLAYFMSISRNKSTNCFIILIITWKNLLTPEEHLACHLKDMSIPLQLASFFFHPVSGILRMVWWECR